MSVCSSPGANMPSQAGGTTDVRPDRNDAVSPDCGAGNPHCLGNEQSENTSMHCNLKARNGWHVAGICQSGIPHVKLRI